MNSNNNILEYKLLQALATVVQESSFERAALRLCVTQSAISQRIKVLEQKVSQPIIIRSSPPRATDIGMKLINYFYQIEHLEKDLKLEIFPETEQETITIHLATNADSLASWLIPAIQAPMINRKVEVNFLIADERDTINFLKNGTAFGAITLHEKPLKGFSSTFLGEFRYALVSSPSFKNLYFKNGVNSKSIQHAPSAAFDNKDDMHINFIKSKFGVNRNEYALHNVRSTEAFIMLAKKDIAYCLIAEKLIEDELKSGTLVDLLQGERLVKRLYWQRWELLKGIHKDISDAIIKSGSELLHN